MSTIINATTTANTAIAHLAHAVWEGFDFFPSAMPTATCQQYLLCLLFLRAISTASKQLPQHGQTWQPYHLLVPEEAQFSTLLAQCEQAGNGDRLQAALDALTFLNPTQLGAQLAVTPFTSPLLGGLQQRDKLLRDLLRHFAQERIALPGLALEPYFFGEAFTEIIRLFADYHQASASYFTSHQTDIERDLTPRPVAQLMARLLDPMPGDVIYDPAFGTGIMLLEAAQWSRHTHQGEPSVLYGREVNADRCALARMRLTLYGLDTTHLIFGDALVCRASESESAEPPKRCPRLSDAITQHALFDVVLSAPPLVVLTDSADSEAASKSVRCAGLGFALTMLARLVPNTGRLGVMLPISALVRKEQQELRRELVQTNAIDSVILLPSCLLQHYPEPAAIVLMKRDSVAAPVYIVDAHQLVQEQGQTLDDVMRQIGQAFLPKREIPGLARFVTWAELDEAKFDFTFPFIAAIEGNAPQLTSVPETSPSLCE